MEERSEKGATFHGGGPLIRSLTYSCDRCGARFVFPANLRKHIAAAACKPGSAAAKRAARAGAAAHRAGSRGHAAAAGAGAADERVKVVFSCRSCPATYASQVTHRGHERRAHPVWACPHPG